MIGNFAACCAFSLVQEGGFCNVKGDPGGATNHGITMAELSAVLGRQATVQDVMNLTAAQSEAIYLPRYWRPVNGDSLPPGLDLELLDWGINCGPETSAKRLQALLGVHDDGVIGPATIAAIGMRGNNMSGLIHELSYSHKAYYRMRPGFSEFGVGWLARVDRCQAAALAMLAA